MVHAWLPSSSAFEATAWLLPLNAAPHSSLRGASSVVNLIIHLFCLCFLFFPSV